MQANKNLPFLARLRFALTGFTHAWRNERSFKTQASALLVALIVLVILRPAPMWWALVALSSAGVLGAELFNTAIERLADHLHPEQHPEIGIVKDCAAAAVLVMVAGALGVAIAFVAAFIRG